MSYVTAGRGSCLCKAVNFTTADMSHLVGACHCNICRKWGGSALLGVECGSNVSFEGEENIGVYQSSEWAERGFCKQCGSHLFYKLKENNQYFIPVGLFDDGEGFKFEHQVFIDEKPEYYSFADETKNMTGAEFFAYFAAQSQNQ